MQGIDELFTSCPLLGSRRVTAMLRAEDHAINRKRVQRLMRKMRITAPGRSPAPASPSRIFPLSAARPRDRAPQPDLVRRHHLRSDRPRLPLSRGDHGLGEPGGWHGGYRTRWTCPSLRRALQESFARFGWPEIFNTDQGSQFTSSAFTGALMAADVRTSMDGRSRWIIERLWRSLKHEDIYRKGYADGREAYAGIAA
ncbi:IS3 family transposase [Bradyrhizobium sp. BR 1432]|uniref:IS3 family transposase n=1 Tax=Bradyrhizobium sp. BR 1432 TaxID=3447966 RepID=UPI003EE7258D